MASMTATEELKAEHEPILVMLDVLEVVAERAEHGRDLDATDLDDVVEFLRVFVDRCHHAKEERALVAEMAEAGVARDEGAIATMFAEHVAARDYMRGFAEAAEALESGYEGARDAIVSNARGYISLIRGHIEKEEGILYPMADQYLRPEQQSRLLTALDRVEEERVGHSKHEELHELLYDLRQSYLGAGAARR